MFGPSPTSSTPKIGPAYMIVEASSVHREINQHVRLFISLTVWRNSKKNFIRYFRSMDRSDDSFCFEW